MKDAAEAKYKFALVDDRKEQVTKKGLCWCLSLLLQDPEMSSLSGQVACNAKHYSACISCCLPARTSYWLAVPAQ